MANWNPKHICRYPGCHQTTQDRYCSLHPKGPAKQDNRPTSAKRGYDHVWRKERAFFLSQPENMFCVDCLQRGIHTFAELVDHIIPHDGDMNLFWDIENWQSLCIVHHNQKTAKEKKRGKRGLTEKEEAKIFK